MPRLGYLLTSSQRMIFLLAADHFSGLIKFYLTEKVKREEVWYIVEYLSCVTDPEQVTEVLDVLMSLCERASKSKMAKRLSGNDISLAHGGRASSTSGSQDLAQRIFVCKGESRTPS